MDVTEYDGTRPLNMQPRFSEPSHSMPPFDTPPGTCVSDYRAMWRLAKWMVRPEGCLVVCAYVFCLLPFGCLSFPIMTIAVGFFGVSVVSQLVQNRAGACLLSLPVRSEAESRVLWFVAVVYFPLIYGVAQLPIRCLIAASEGIAVSRVYLTASDCILAMGVGSVLFLSRPLWHRSPPQDALPRPRYSLRDMILIGIYLTLLPLLMPSMYRDEGAAPSAIYSGVVAAAVLITAVSYWSATRNPSVQWLIPRSADSQASISLPWMGKGSHRGAISFLDMWLTPLQVWTGYVSFMLALVCFLAWAQVGAMAKVPDISYNLVLPVAAIPLMLFVQQFNEMDYRLIRSLPLRRWQQVMLVFSFALPMVLPVSFTFLVVTPFTQWSLIRVVTFLVAYSACCTFVISLGATLKTGGVLGAMLLSLPILMAFPIIESPWVFVVYGGYAITFGSVAFVNLFREFCGDGSLYNKADDFADGLAGRGNWTYR